MFTRLSPGLQLTSPDGRRSSSRLPLWTAPRAPKGTSLTYHLNPERWRVEGTYASLQSVAKGQAFVMQTGHTIEAEHPPAWSLKKTESGAEEDRQRQ